jgi:hypothetical protein
MIQHATPYFYNNMTSRASQGLEEAHMKIFLLIYPNRKGKVEAMAMPS